MVSYVLLGDQRLSILAVLKKTLATVLSLNFADIKVLFIFVVETVVYIQIFAELELQIYNSNLS